MSVRSGPGARRTLLDLSKGMHAAARALPLGSVSDRPHVRGRNVPAFNVEQHDALVVLWCAYRLRGGDRGLYEWLADVPLEDES